MDEQKQKDCVVSIDGRFDLDEHVQLNFTHQINQFEIDLHLDQNVLKVPKNSVKIQKTTRLLSKWWEKYKIGCAFVVSSD